MARPQSWTLTQDPDQSCSVLRGNRLVRTGLTPLDAQRLVGRSRAPTERVFHAEPDGYRTEITRQFSNPALSPGSAPTTPEAEPKPHSEPVPRGPRPWPRHHWGRR